MGSKRVEVRDIIFYPDLNSESRIFEMLENEQAPPYLANVGNIKICYRIRQGLL